MLSTHARRITAWSVLAIVLLAILARTLMPAAIKQGIVHWFDEQEVDARVADISLDITAGQFTLTGLEAVKDGEDVFSLDTLFIDWSWHALSDHVVKINAVNLAALKLAIDQASEKRLIVAGIDLQKLAEDADDDTDDDNKDDAPATSETSDWQVKLAAIKLTDFDVCYTDRSRSRLDTCMKFADFDWQGDIVYGPSVATASTVPLTVRGGLSVQQLVLHNTTLDRDTLKLASFSIDGAHIDTPNDINVDNFSIDMLSLLQRVNDDPAPDVTSLKRLIVSKLHFTDLSTLHIAELKIIDHDASILVGKNKRLEVLEWLPEKAETSEPAGDSGSSPFMFSVDTFIYESDRSLRYIDNSLPDRFIVNLNHTHLTVTDIDSSQPEQASKLDYSALYDQHGKIELHGTATLFSPRPSFVIDGKLAGLDLRSISAFTRDAIGHSIKSGQLDANLNLQAEHGTLNSELDLSLYQFELKALSKKDADKLDASFGFPLNTSLMLLKDRDNSIHLSIPVTGDIDKPDFDPNDAITTATSKAITAAVLNYYTPYGLVFAADSLFSLATALRFDPIEFTPGSSDLGSEAKQSLASTAELLSERPGVRLTLCGFSNSEDRKALLPDIELPAEGKKLVLDDNQIATLNRLADARSSAIKQALVDSGIDASRLIQCEPAHEEDGELSGVEISI